MRHSDVHGNRREPDRANGGLDDGVGAGAQYVIIPARNVERLRGWVLENLPDTFRRALVGEPSVKVPPMTIRRWELEAGMVRARAIEGVFSPKSRLPDGTFRVVGSGRDDGGSKSPDGVLERRDGSAPKTQRVLHGGKLSPRGGKSSADRAGVDGDVA